jgi:hypothetical protein
MIKYKVAQESVNLKHSLVLSGMFTYESSSQFVERYHSIFSCALSMEDIISNKRVKLSL